MSENPLVLTFDVGTQSARAMLVDKNGNIVCQKQKNYEKPYFSPQPGWAEQDAKMYWDTMCQMSRLLKDENEAVWGDIIAVTCTSIRATTICLDKNGQPLRNAVVWLDKRRTENLPPVPLKNRLLFKAAGVFDAVDSIRSNLACNWIIKNQPDIWAKTDKFVLLSTYLNLLFTGNLVDSKANIVGVLPYSNEKGDWLAKNDLIRPLYLLEDDKLFDLVAPGAIIGKITAEAAEKTGIPEGIPYVATGADKACETLALSGADEECAALSFSTIATIEVFSRNYFSAYSVVPPFTAINDGYLPEIETYRGYWLISWFKNEFAAKEVMEAEALGCSAEDLLNQRLKDIPPGCHGLVMQPTFTPDSNTPHAKGAIIGLSDVHTRPHLYRAIVEGINYSMIEGLEIIEKKGKRKVKKILVTGGGSRSAEICQITANMFGLPVSRIQTHEACGIGCSMVGFVAMGVYADYAEASKAMVHIKDTFTPDMEEHKIYRQLYSEVYTKIFDNLSGLYKTLNKIISGI